MLRNRNFHAVTMAFLFACGNPVADCAADTFGTIAGFARDRIPGERNQHPGIAGVSVVATTEDGKTIEAVGGTTSSTGRYRVENVPAGEVTVRFRLLGWINDPTTKKVTVDAGQTVALDAFLMLGNANPRNLARFGNYVESLPLEKQRAEWKWVRASNAPTSFKVQVTQTLAETVGDFMKTVPEAKPYAMADLEMVKRVEKNLASEPFNRDVLIKIKFDNASLPRTVMADLAVQSAWRKFGGDGQGWGQFNQDIAETWGRTFALEMKELWENSAANGGETLTPPPR